MRDSQIFSVYHRNIGLRTSQSAIIIRVIIFHFIYFYSVVFMWADVFKFWNSWGKKQKKTYTLLHMKTGFFKRPHFPSFSADTYIRTDHRLWHETYSYQTLGSMGSCSIFQSPYRVWNLSQYYFQSQGLLHWLNVKNYRYLLTFFGVFLHYRYLYFHFTRVTAIATLCIKEAKLHNKLHLLRSRYRTIRGASAGPDHR